MTDCLQGRGHCGGMEQDHWGRAGTPDCLSVTTLG